jgi:plastocyanin
MMSRRLVFVSIIAQVALIVACSRSPVEPGSAPSTAGPAAAIAAHAPALAPAALAGGREDVRVNMLDACDPDSFNAAIGAGSCVRSGGMKFDQFVAQLTKLAFAAPWRFAPQNTNVRVGQTFVAENMGGEAHTFTEVAEYGGGIVPFLNQLAHTPTVAPACAALEGDDFVAPGASYREQVDHAGTVKFQCCIHPWMRMEATVR